jgi:nicotinate-nucleotide adenylyltransferase
MKIGLFFGSFNPVHIGHMIIANYMATQTPLEQVWFVVSPQNPLKSKKGMARDYDRLHLVRLAIGDNTKLKASNIEFGLPKPSYTIDTLVYLKEKHPEHEFVLIMGGDNLGSFQKWKNYEIILRDYEIYVYKRPAYEMGELENHPKVKIFEAPLMQISASYIRNCIKAGHTIQYLVTEEVFEYLNSSSLYK